jgi:surface polysaccharide O-acyltransferase-like enzyme
LLKLVKNKCLKFTNCLSETDDYRQRQFKRTDGNLNSKIQSAQSHSHPNDVVSAFVQSGLSQSFRTYTFVENEPLSYYISLFCDACVPIFCFVSGYGLFFNYQKNTAVFNKANRKRLLKLYINYWIILLLFAVGLGFALRKEGYPGNLIKFLLNFSGLDNSYNGAWWFFTTYIILVLTSIITFKWVVK